MLKKAIPTPKRYVLPQHIFHLLNPKSIYWTRVAMSHWWVEGTIWSELPNGDIVNGASTEAVAFYKLPFPLIVKDIGDFIVFSPRSPEFKSLTIIKDLLKTAGKSEPRYRINHQWLTLDEAVNQNYITVANVLASEFSNIPCGYIRSY